MAVINRVALLADEKLWLPDGNVLSDAHMESINESIIAQIGDDGGVTGIDGNYPEILCKALRAIALTNQAKASVDSNGKKKEKVGDVEVENFEQTSTDKWKGFADSLRDICPIFGYTPTTTPIGMKINPSEKFMINKCHKTSDLIL